jgi:DNA-binding NarL/FixJ family response regulator
MIRVLVVDDQPLIRAGVARILSVEDGFDVVGECGDGTAVADAVARLDPDLVLMDVRMPHVDGTTATRRLREANPSRPPVLILTTFDDDDALWGAIEAGAAGFILKDSDADSMLAAARAVAGGAAWLDPKVAPRVLSAARLSAAGPGTGEARFDELTDREHDVLRLMARGATNREIADSLHVSQATVKTHVGAIFAKLGVRDRAAAIIHAYDRGVVRPRRAGASDVDGRFTN